MSNDKTREAFLAALNKVSDGAYLIPGWDVHSIKAALSASEGAAPVAVDELARVKSDRDYAAEVALKRNEKLRSVAEQLRNIADSVFATTPQPAVKGAGLSDAEIIERAWSGGLICLGGSTAYMESTDLRPHIVKFARAILAAAAPDDQARPVAAHADDGARYRFIRENSCPVSGVLEVLTTDTPPIHLHGERMDGAIDALIAGKVAAPTAPPAVAGDPDVADIITGALQTSRAHAYELMRDALKDTSPAPAAEAPSYGIIDPDYARVFTMARCIAWSEGYALAMNGSFTRDLDLLAVPWTESACDPEHLIARIADATGLRPTGHALGIKPHGRIASTLVFPGFTCPRFVDVSVMPCADTRPAGPLSEVTDAQRLDFMIRECAWIVWTKRDGSIRQCQLWTQDADEVTNIIPSESRFFNTAREAIDAAIAATSAEEGQA